MLSIFKIEEFIKEISVTEPSDISFLKIVMIWEMARYQMFFGELLMRRQIKMINIDYNEIKQEIGEVCTYFAICDIVVWENLEEEEREKVLWESTR